MHIRPAVDDDHDAYVRLFAELAVPEGPPPRDRFVSSMRDDVLVAEGDDGVVGVVWARARGALWHIVHIMSDPLRRRQGIGRALLAAAAARGRARGFARWMLNVKPDNVAARALYERIGMAEVLASTVVRLAWRDVARLPRADDVVTGPLDEDVDAVPGLSLLPGELAAARALPGRVFAMARRGDDVVGVAGFDPAFAGSPLFRVVDPDVARPLLEALAPCAPAGDERLRVYVEGQPGVRDVLVDAGGEVVMRVLRLEGHLP
jgi:GNAT superfamily N-acetyltransferase